MDPRLGLITGMSLVQSDGSGQVSLRRPGAVFLAEGADPWLVVESRVIGNEVEVGVGYVILEVGVEDVGPLGTYARPS